MSTRLRTTKPSILVNAPGDASEREAERVSHAVLQTDPNAPTTAFAVQRSVGGPASGDSTAPASVSQVLARRGHPLAPHLRHDMEARFGFDFSRVRIHSDAEAQQSARDVRARAYTVGTDIVFGRNQFAPERTHGRALLAHELVHVIQQAGGAAGRASGGGGSAQLLQRSPTTDVESPPEQTTVPPVERQRVDVTELKYACVFVGKDLYGIQARRFVRTAMPEHQLIEAASMEEAMVKMRDHARAALRGGAAARITQVVLIAHGNATGFVKIPLIKGQTGTTPEALGKLQDEFRAGAHEKFREARTDLIGLFGNGTEVIVRGCRVGRSQEAVDALAAFFGGQSTIYAAKEYQAFTRRRIASFDSNPRQAAIAAYEHLVMQGVVPSETVVTDDDKVRWVAGHLPAGFVPESFLVDEEDVEQVRHATADTIAIQSLKDYTAAQLIGLDKWGVSKRAEPDDAELDPMSADEIVALAADKLAAFDRLESETPDDWRNIGELAWWVLRCHYAWSRKPEAMVVKADERDPVARLWMPGLSYDTNLLAMRAARRPDLQVFHRDAFDTANLVMPARPTSEEVESALAPAESKPGQALDSAPSDATVHARPTTAGAAASSRAAPASTAPPPATLALPEDRISPDAAMPKPPIAVDLSEAGGTKAETALVLRGEFKRQFEIKYERQLGYLKVRKATVEFNGKVDFKSDGQKELVIGAFGALATKPGERVGGAGDRLETTLVKGADKETGVSGKVTGGVELGGQNRTKDAGDAASTASGMKREIYIGAQVAWGPIAQELKLVVIGHDETKSGTDQFTILGLKWSPIVVQGEFELPVSDGTKVKFVGSVKLTIEAEPDWPKIMARLGEMVGRQVAVEAGAITAGGAAATGAGAGAAEATTVAGGAAVGELVIAGGFVAIGAALVYAYFKSVEEIEDHKALQHGAKAGVADFCGGYLAHLGIPAGGQPSGAFWTEGQRHAELQLQARVRRAARMLNERYQQQLFTDDAPDLRAAILDGVKADASSWRTAVYFSYETAIRTLFYKAWLARVAGTAAERNAVYARAHAGLSSVELADEPDYAWVNAVGTTGASGMRRPKHAR
jgi:hypothetical protein